MSKNTKRTIKRLKVESKIDFGQKYYGYTYHICLDDDYLAFRTNNKILYDTLQEGEVYTFEYEPTNDHFFAPNGGCYLYNMKRVKLLNK